MYKIIDEGDVKVYVPEEEKVSKSLPVFFNQEMKLNRDIALYIINKLKPERCLDAMAGTGVRALRILKETSCRNVVANDLNPEAAKLIKRNAELNKLDLDVHNKDLNVLLREEQWFDYIDIDPFGSPAYHLDSASIALRNNGVLAITATDLGCLYGKFVNRCRLRYSSTPLKCHFGNETGIRILIQKAQCDAAKHEKALFPIFVHATKHYVRAYLRCLNSSSFANRMMKGIGYIQYCPKCLRQMASAYPYKEKCCDNDMLLAGPMWLGHLWEEKIAEDFELIKHIKEESTIHTVGYHHIPTFCKKYNLPQIKRIGNIIEDVKSKGYLASRTHFEPQAVRTNMPHDEFVKLI